MEKDPTETNEARGVYAADTVLRLDGGGVEYVQIPPEILRAYAESLEGLPSVTFDVHLGPFIPKLEVGVSADEMSIDEGVAITEEQWERIAARLAGLPNVTVHASARPPDRTVEYLTLIQTWSPQDRDAAGRFRDQVAVMLQAEAALGHPYMLGVIGALGLAMRDAHARLDERAELLARSLVLMEQAKAYFDQVIALAARCPENAELVALAAAMDDAFNSE